MGLNTYVHTVDADGVAHVFGPGDDVPRWARDKIGDRPDVWEDDSPDVGPTVPQEPPRAGRGSGRDEWARFAGAHGVAVGEDDSRDDVIDALIERGVVEG